MIKRFAKIFSFFLLLQFLLVSTSLGRTKTNLDQFPIFLPSKLSTKEYYRIERLINRSYPFFKRRHPTPNKKLERFVHFLYTYPLASSIRFKRDVIILKRQKSVTELLEYMYKSRWYREYLTRITNDPAYEYMASRGLRIFMTTHVASHYFEVPFPTLFCLIFQESKFDFKVNSYTGAIGLGQLTSIGMRQIKRLRRFKRYEGRLQNATRYLGQTYHDPFILKYLRKLGFYPKFPVVVKFPKNMEYNLPQLENYSITSAVGRELVKRGHDYGKNFSLVEKMNDKVRRGYMIAGKYAPFHAAYADVLWKTYGRHLGNAYNPETSIFYSAILMRYYYNYNWKIGRRKIRFQPSVRSILAASAYNRGQSVVRKFLKSLKTDYPKIKFHRLNVHSMKRYFTKNRFYRVLKGDKIEAGEIASHIQSIYQCSVKFNKKLN
ncbi:MAG: hypothetical protein ACI86H_001686 [bacterium]|jgi:hypothetical protein